MADHTIPEKGVVKWATDTPIHGGFCMLWGDKGVGSNHPVLVLPCDERGETVHVRVLREARDAFEELAIASVAAKSSLCQGHQSHWDSKGTHGANCPACIENGNAVDRLRPAINAANNVLARIDALLATTDKEKA